MDQRIAAVVVTFNRKNLLVECLRGLLNQSKSVDKIFVINNASTDGTEELLKSMNLLSHPHIEYIKLNENIGAAGGFHEGIKLAHLNNYDWIWTMDDDVVAFPNTLENLLTLEHISACIHPVRLLENGQIFEWEKLLYPTFGIEVGMNDISFKNGKEWCCVNVGCFEGMLIHRSIVDKIGYPDKRFFICEDDTTYGYKASLYTNVVYTRKAIIQKQLSPTSALTNQQLYYITRNYLLKVEPLIALGFRKKFFFIFLLFYISLKRFTKCLLIERNFQRCFLIIKAIFHSLTNKFGKANL